MKPRLVVFAGPNGSGKTTFARALLGRGHDLGEYIDPDQIAKEEHGRPVAAGTSALLKAARRRDACLEARRDFGFETVLSHRNWLVFLERAVVAGYDVVVFYVGIGDPLENVKRVRLRAASGGHTIPDHVVIERWHRTMNLLPEVAAVVDRLYVFDNGEQGDAAAIRPVAQTRRTQEGYEIRIWPDAPLWVRERLG